MQDTVQRSVSQIASDIDERAIGPVLRALADRLSSQAFNAAGLAIATTTTKIKTSNTVKYMANGSYVSVAAADNLITLSTDASVPANQVGGIVVYGDALGAISYSAGVPAAAANGIKWPNTPQGKAIIGFVVIAAGASVFTGGTTALTGGTVTVTYTDTTGAFDPSILLGV